MSDQFVDSANAQMGFLERLLKGLPGISGYVDRELRRNADYRVRQLIADTLALQKQALLEIQRKLLKGGGLAVMDDVDVLVTKLQTLTDRVRTAAYGYSGLFDAVRIRKGQLDALHRFDVALMAELAQIETALTGLTSALGNNSAVESAIGQLSNAVLSVTNLFNRRDRAVESPDLLSEATYAPEIDPKILEEATQAQDNNPAS